MNQRGEIQNTETKSRNKSMKKFSILVSGEGRGNALLILIAGMALVIVGIVFSILKSVKTLEEEVCKNETITKSCPQGL